MGDRPPISADTPSKIVPPPFKLAEIFGSPPPALVSEQSAAKAGNDTVALPTVEFKKTAGEIVVCRKDSGTAKIFAQNKDASVLIQVDTKTDVNSKGSGIIVSPDGKVITDLHVVAGAGEITVISASGKTYTASIVDRDASNDLALLQINGAAKEKFATVKLAASAAALTAGDQVTGLGYPLQSEVLHALPGSFRKAQPLNEFKIQGGFLPGENETRSVMNFQIGAPTGSSGGGIFRPSDGAMVGIVGMSNAQVALGTPVEHIVAFLKQARVSGYTVVPVFDKLAPQVSPARARPPSVEELTRGLPALKHLLPKQTPSPFSPARPPEP